MADRDQKIRNKAYELWEAAGRPEGRQGEHWAEAERLVAAEEAGEAKPAKKRARKAAPAGETETDREGEVPVVRKKRASAPRKKKE